MVPVLSLWLPLILSAVIVFFASFVMHMVLPYHWGQLKQLPREDDVMTALRGFNIPPGDYGVPCPDSPKAMRDPAFLEKRAKGPVMLMTVLPGGPNSMGKNLAQWFVYGLVVNTFAAYITGRALSPGADYLAVFRFVGTTAFLGYSLALAQTSIWSARAWSTTLTSMFDGLVYGLLTAGRFGWLWPR
jgi:quinol-cytochrome oxidoreductase complex cytochrome b subunit